MPTQERAKLNVSNWKDIWPKNNTCCPTTPQLMGNVPEHFVETTKLLNETYGYTHFNWNIGCPVAQVVRRKRGCGVMPETDRVEAVVKAMTEQTDFVFSIKMRLGLHSPDEGLRILERMEKYPLEYICIHPRLGEQLYEGVPDWDTFDCFCQNTSHRLIYSGDIVYKSDYETLQQRYPNIQDWMLGRGILRNPFLAEEIKGIPTGDKRERFLKYYQLWVADLLPLRKERGTLHNLKELWHYYADFVSASPEDLRNLLRINEFDKFFDRSLEMLKG